jgi:glutamine cyclotransferase
MQNNYRVSLDMGYDIIEHLAEFKYAGHAFEFARNESAIWNADGFTIKIESREPVEFAQYGTELVIYRNGRISDYIVVNGSVTDMELGMELEKEKESDSNETL